MDEAHDMKHRGNRSVLYAVAGAVLSLGAPGGLLVLRELYVPRPIADELFSDRVTYLYVFLSTAIVLSFLGYLLGRQADRLAALAETDALTGLANRRALAQRLAEEFDRSARYGAPVSLLLVDIDGLKQVNDSGGHAAGDQLIRGVGDAIRRSLRHSDFAARWGGDEFAIVAPNTTAEAARSSAERLIGHVAKQGNDSNNRSATVSIGIASFDPSQQRHADVKSLVRAADEALYRAKTTGRNRVHAA